MGRKSKQPKKDLKYFQTMTLDGLVDNPKQSSEELKTDDKKVDEKSIDNRKLFAYRGAVYRYADLVIPDFKATTKAKSEKEARNNIRYQAKMRLKLLPSVGGIKLTGHLVQVDD